MWPDIPRPVLFAHRGSSAHAPENTLAAFKLAARQGADAVELDVKLSKDGHVIVIHDQRVDRTTDGIGSVAGMTLAELRTLDAGAYFAKKFQGERIPTLDEVFEETRRLLFINIELANYLTPGDDLVERTSQVVKRHAMKSRVLFSSFFGFNLRHAARLLPEVPCGLLIWPGWKGVLQRRYGWRGPYQALHPYLTEVNERLIRLAHQAGKFVHVWTINDRPSLQKVTALGVDGIFTDDPALIRPMLRRKP